MTETNKATMNVSKAFQTLTHNARALNQLGRIDHDREQRAAVYVLERLSMSREDLAMAASKSATLLVLARQDPAGVERSKRLDEALQVLVAALGRLQSEREA